VSNLIETKVSSTDKVKAIYTAQNISEQTQTSGFAFSRRLAAQSGLKPEDISTSFCQGAQIFKYAALAGKLAADSAGGATIGENSIRIQIADDHANAGSEADYLWMYFGRERRVRLDVGGGRFTAGSTYTWDLNEVGDWLEDHVAADLWDEITLKTDSNDGMKVQSIRIKHSGQIILDWQCRQWLDGSRLEKYGWLVLTAKILQQKLDQIGGMWIPQIHWAAREIGKTDGQKYGAGAGDAWCSEFASWCLRKALWDTPGGSIGSQRMEDFFAGLDRKYTHDQLIAEEYQLTAGDYIRFQWAGGGQHSGIFIEYVDDPDNPTDDTTIRTIEGNASSTVKVATRDFRDILSVGSCR
jgi:hypothetical protein